MSNKIYCDFKKVIKRYQLIITGDVVAVEISADRNSVALLDCLMEYKKEMKGSFSLNYFVVQKGNAIAKETKEIIESYKIDNYVVISEDRTEEVYEILGHKGCTKVALPHNYNDIINCTLMTLMQRKEVAQIHPKRESSEAKNLQFIRPLCTTEDRAIEKYLSKQGKAYIEEVTLLSKLSFIEENIVMPEERVNAQFQFNIYERV